LLTSANGSGYFLYRIGLAAHAGAAWSITVHDGAGQKQLLSDSDVAPLTKCWLVGTCPFRSAPRHPKNGMGGYRRTTVPHQGSRAGQLVLLRGEHSSKRHEVGHLPITRSLSDTGAD
jgi:hypothetical protein